MADGTPYPVLDIYGEDTPIDFLFTYRDKPFIARGNVQTLKGREKAGKSAFGVALIVAALKGEFAGVKPCKDNLRVLWIDTEQDTTTLRQRAKAALSMAGKDGEIPDTLVIVPLRGFVASDRVAAVASAVENETPDFVFLDGAVDLCADFNDNKESAATVAALTGHTEKHKCALLAVIHTNKKDDEARGHLGTMLQQKSSEVYEVTKTGGTATMKQQLCRFAGIPDMKLKFEDNFRLQPAGGGMSEADAKVERMRETFSGICGAQKEWRYTDLVAEYEQMEGVGTRWAKNAVAEALKAGVLFKNGNGKEAIYTYLFPKDDDSLL